MLIEDITVKKFRAILDAYPDEGMHWQLPDKSYVPMHYHITEVGKAQKDFIDCGGTVRSSASCVLQVWVAADDLEHRINTTKLLGIMSAAESLPLPENLPVEVEYDSGVISQYPLVAVEPTSCGLIFYLGTKHTACLAPDKCGIGRGCC